MNTIYNDENYWSQNDISELNEIVKIYDKSLKDAYGSSDLVKAYSNYSYEFSNSLQGKGSFIAPQGMDIKIQNLKVFDKIWKKYSISIPDSESINLYPESPYFDYLNGLPNNSTFLKSYIENFENTNDITPSMVYGFADNGIKGDYSNINNRVVFAIHYLTLMNR
ncbi:hypothetical protein [Ulvibacter sp. MAR_2010_11]|uniref:hypothetical protein n=1 Tax=Ulvibacter sp. MAR_2010_11 TaxID=1250229 RepID=UPI000C2BDED8|nr:hypothetical protein [Ulvibacter sp. MAR_2010_11]